MFKLCCCHRQIFIIFQVVVVGQFYSITPSLLSSLPVGHLETQGGWGEELPYEEARDTHWKI